MVPKDETRRNTESANEGFDGRELLVGRPEGEEGQPTTEPSQSAPAPPPTVSPQPGARDDAIGGILATV